MPLTHALTRQMVQATHRMLEESGYRMPSHELLLRDRHLPHAGCPKCYDSSIGVDFSIPFCARRSSSSWSSTSSASGEQKSADSPECKAASGSPQVQMKTLEQLHI